MLTAEEARKKFSENEALQNALKKSVEMTLKGVEKAIKNGETHTFIERSVYYVDGEMYSVDRELLLNELLKLGYKQYTKPVYIDGVPQRTISITWL